MTAASESSRANISRISNAHVRATLEKIKFNNCNIRAIINCSESEPVSELLPCVSVKKTHKVRSAYSGGRMKKVEKFSVHHPSQYSLFATRPTYCAAEVQPLQTRQRRVGEMGGGERKKIRRMNDTEREREERHTRG